MEPSISRTPTMDPGELIPPGLPPPTVVTKFIDTVLRENDLLIDVINECQDLGRVSDMVAYLEVLQANMFALGKLADMQQISVGEFPDRTKPVPWGTAQEAMREHGRAVRTMLQAYRFATPPEEKLRRFHNQWMRTQQGKGAGVISEKAQLSGKWKPGEKQRLLLGIIELGWDNLEALARRVGSRTPQQIAGYFRRHRRTLELQVRDEMAKPTTTAPAR